MEGKVGIEGMPYKRRPELTELKEYGHGPANIWYENGQKWWEVNYKDGEVDGLATRWYENGQKHYEANYKDGMEDGLKTYWYENGQKREEGLWTNWHENGRKNKEGNYKDGKRDGLWIYYKEDGTEWIRTRMKDGNEVGVVDNDDGTGGRQTYKDGEIVKD